MHKVFDLRMKNSDWMRSASVLASEKITERHSERII